MRLDLHCGRRAVDQRTGIGNAAALDQDGHPAARRAVLRAGVGRHGLVRGSELADRLVERPSDAVHVGQAATLGVLGVDRERGRISLSRRSNPSARGCAGARGQALSALDKRSRRWPVPLRVAAIAHLGYDRGMSKGVLALAILTIGCTHWGRDVVYGPPREVGRRLVGAPQVAETTTSATSVGFAAGGVSDGVSAGAAGGLAANSGTVKRTHCVQQAEIDFTQPVHTVPELRLRWLDVASSVILGLGGLGAIQVGANQPADLRDNHNSDFYITGGVLIGAGVGLLLYSYLWVPSRAPGATDTVRSWTETTFIESTGCGLVPADVAPASTSPSTPDAQKRLEQLEELHRAGTITDEEYQQKRRQILDSI